MAILRRGLEADFLFESKGYKGDLRVVSFTGKEELSRLFSFHMDLASKDGDIDLNAVVGQPAALTIKSVEGERTIHGLVARMEEGGKGEEFVPYKALLVPEAWLLGRFFRSRIFQKVTVKDIVQEVLKGAGIPTSRFRFALTRALPAREYCVQYRETDWAFISRLLEEEGIFYFFEQKDKETVLVMGDSVNAVVAIGKPEKIPFREPSAAGAAKEAVYEFRFAQELRSGKYALKDYNFTRPDVLVDGEAKAKRDDKLEIYDYPGYYIVAESGGAADAEKFKSGDLTSLGKDIAQIRLEEEQATRCRAEGLALCRRFLPGFFFELADHSRFGGKYLLVSVTHTGSQPAVPAAGVPKVTYQNEFSCIPNEVVFRPARLTPKPIVKGVQNAWVTGPKGEEIYTDSYGRVKVQFPWDRQGKKDDKTSCWVRVSSAWAGKGWGAIYIPRIGWEVLVDFIEGDPDRPIIIGAVYNGSNLPPYKLPDEKTKSTLKSDSSKGSGGFNEIRLEDAKGKEEIFIHAEKNLDLRVKNDRREWVGSKSHLIVKNEKFETIEKDRHEVVKGNHMEEIQGDRSLKMEGKESVEIAKSQSLTVKGDVIWIFKSGHYEEAGSDIYLKAKGKVIIDGQSGVTLQCGGNSVVVDMSGVTVKGTSLTLDGTMLKMASGPGSPPGVGKPAVATTPTKPADPEEAGTAESGEASEGETGGGGGGGGAGGGGGSEESEETETTWVEIVLKDKKGNPVPGEAYELKLADGSLRKGSLDENGKARVSGIPPGQCEVKFPKTDKTEWRKV